MNAEKTWKLILERSRSKLVIDLKKILVWVAQRGPQHFLNHERKSTNLKIYCNIDYYRPKLRNFLCFFYYYFKFESESFTSRSLDVDCMYFVVWIFFSSSPIAEQRLFCIHTRFCDILLAKFSEFLFHKANKKIENSND